MANPAEIQDLGSTNVPLGYTYPYASLANILPSLALGNYAGEKERTMAALDAMQKHEQNLAQTLPSFAKSGMIEPSLTGQGDFEGLGIPWNLKQPQPLSFGEGGLAGMPTDLEAAKDWTTVKKNMIDIENNQLDKSSKLLNLFPMMRNDLENQIRRSIAETGMVNPDSIKMSTALTQLEQLFNKNVKIIKGRKPKALPDEVWETWSEEHKKEFLEAWENPSIPQSEKIKYLKQWQEYGQKQQKKK